MTLVCASEILNQGKSDKSVIWFLHLYFWFDAKIFMLPFQTKRMKRKKNV